MIPEAPCPVPDVNKGNLTPREHSRDAAGLTYVYPVISRRARGLSIGINLNPNNACNWHCIYCQVPNLGRGRAPSINLNQLHDELTGFLTDVMDGTFFRKMDVPTEHRRIRDIAVSGNGEATSAPEFNQVMELIGRVRMQAGLDNEVRTVLITNGSLVQRSAVRAGLAYLNRLNGEVWFKVDAATHSELQQLNGASLSPERMFNNLRVTAGLCKTWVQTCAFALDGKPAMNREDYLVFMQRIVDEQLPVAGVLLYGLARQPMQAEAERLSKLPAEWLENFALDIRRLGLPVRVTE